MGSKMNALSAERNRTRELAPSGRAADALAFIHSALVDPGHASADPEGFLARLAEALAGEAAGFAAFLEDGLLKKLRHSSTEAFSGAATWPWEASPALIQQSWTTTDAVALNASGTSVVLSGAEKPDGIRWLLWVEGSAERSWQPGEKAALALGAQMLDRFLVTPEENAVWHRAIELKRFQRHLDQAALVTGRVAHDFGNVLTALLGYSEMALPKLAPGSTAHQHVTEIYQAAQQGAAMIRKLSLFSTRRPAGKRACALQLVVSGEVSRTQKSWPPEVLLKLDLAPKLPAIAVDGESLRLLLEQVLENGREAIRGSGAVTLSARMVELTDTSRLDYLGAPAPGPALEIVVADTGSGISPGALKRLRSEIFVTTKPGRRGLGLAVVHSILLAARGGIKIEAGAQGTIVRLVLPTAQAPAVSLEPKARTATAARERILVVDDDPLTLEMIDTVLGQEGYHVQCASGAAEALKLYTRAVSEPFQLVVSDLMMAEMSGYDLARKLLQQHPAVNLMFITGHVSAQPFLEDRAFGNVAVLAKPFRADGLLRAVRAALDHRDIGTARTLAARETPKPLLVPCTP
jgi:signal transduction histidine kinase/FixJ family two-component response regulator